MTRNRFLLTALLLAGCLDFDVLRTEPTTGATSSSGTGAGGAGGGATGTGGLGGGGGSGGGSTTNTGGAGGAGGSFPDLPPCGDLQDNFDGGQTLDWNVLSGSFTQDQATAPPPQSLFRLNVSQATDFVDCSVLVEFVDSVASGQMYFEWSLAGDFSRVLRILTNNQNMTRIDLTSDAGMITNPPLLDPSPFVTGWARISNLQGNYRIETAAMPTGPWSLRVEILAADAPAWLSQPGVVEFGTYNATGSPAAFDNFNSP
jgi:hypothetical protein